MKQTSFAQAEFAAKKKITRRGRFLAEMEQAVPWSRLYGSAFASLLSRFPRQARTPAHSPEAHFADVLCSAVVCPGRRSTGRRHL